MLEGIRRKSQGLVTWIIIGTIALAFIFLGLSDFFGSKTNSGVAAKVNGKKISWAQVDDLYDRMQRQMGDKADPKTLKEQLRNALVQRTILLEAARRLGFKVTDVQIAKTLNQIPAFQVDGKFSKERYLQVLKDAGYSDEGFRYELTQDILLGQLEQGLSQSSFSLSNELRRIISLIEEKRDIGYTLIPTQKFKALVKIDPQDVKNYYEGHQSSFIIPEKVALEYVELSVDDLAKNVSINNNDEVKAYYEEHLASYEAPERVHAKHILISTSDMEESKAKETADKIMTQLKSGGNFEALAKEHSKDTASAKKGGDLGWFTKGQMVPEFEKAAFGTKKPNELAGPIKTVYGYHILQIMEHKPAETRAFNEVQELVKEQLQREKAQTQFLEKSEQLAKLAFENVNTLQPIAEQLSLKVKDTNPFNRQGGGDPFTSHPEVIRAAFTDEVLKEGNNSVPLKLNDNTIAIIRLKKHEPAKQQTLAEAEKQIKERLMLEGASKKAQEEAETLVKKINEGAKPELLTKEKSLKWNLKKEVSRNSTDIDRNIVAVTFQIPRVEDSKPNLKTTVLPNGDYLVLALNNIHEGDFSKVDDSTKQSYRQGLADVMGQMEFSLYAMRLINQAKIEMSQIISE